MLIPLRNCCYYDLHFFQLINYQSHWLRVLVWAAHCLFSTSSQTKFFTVMPARLSRQLLVQSPRLSMLSDQHTLWPHTGWEAASGLIVSLPVPIFAGVLKHSTENSSVAGGTLATNKAEPGCCRLCSWWHQSQSWCFGYLTRVRARSMMICSEMEPQEQSISQSSYKPGPFHSWPQK